MNRGSSVLRRGASGVAVAALTLAGLAAGGSAPAAAIPAPECMPTAAFNECRIFESTGAKEDFVVPAGITRLEVRAWGQGGGGDSMTVGGDGAFVSGTVKVTPGEKLTVRVAGSEHGRFGDALGGKGGYDAAQHRSGNSGGSSSSLRTAGGDPLVIAAGGGGGSFYGLDIDGGIAGDGGAENGKDASEGDLGGKGAKGDKGGAGGTGEAGNGTAGADAKDGGAGGDAAPNTGGGGGGAGWAGGGGGGEKARFYQGSGGGGSSYADDSRVIDVEMVESDGSYPPRKDDPFWDGSPYNSPVDAPPYNPPGESGIADGAGGISPGGRGRVVLQWHDANKPVVDTLSKESGDNQTVGIYDRGEPLVVSARTKDGRPVPGESVTFTIVKPGQGWFEDHSDRKQIVKTDAQGRARVEDLTGNGEGTIKVVAETNNGKSVEFTRHVKKDPTDGIKVEAVSGGGQQAEAGKEFAEPLVAMVTQHGGKVNRDKVEFRVESQDADAPAFEDGKRIVEATSDMGTATSPKLIAGKGTGEYTVVAHYKNVTATFKVEVLAKNGQPSPSPSPSEGAGSGGDDGPGSDNSGTSGPGSDDDGGLALTGATGIGLLAGIGILLAAAGLAAVRLAPRLRARTRN
ncbi:glycine-rich protein [Streptomyces sp. N35]|uniref:glycine-rich protein n=1 Tax=Streptomyces sp. N35 TaxID=2795730 RepID=UPI0018F362BF|nr:glycine-rich protein [Streptomyces sp. N35]